MLLGTSVPSTVTRTVTPREPAFLQISFRPCCEMHQELCKRLPCPGLHAVSSGSSFSELKTACKGVLDGFNFFIGSIQT